METTAQSTSHSGLQAPKGRLSPPKIRPLALSSLLHVGPLTLPLHIEEFGPQVDPVPPSPSPAGSETGYPERQLIHQDLDSDVALNEETHIMNNNRKFSGALGLLLVADGLQEAIKKVQ